MSYRPYEVEDQDNLQRGHIAEYLVMAQNALRDRLIAEAQAGGTEPSAQWMSDYDRMKQWRELAVTLFRRGDYLHSEYAARNASLAARGVPQTPENTSEPKLVEAGQIFYFNVHAQQGPDTDLADLEVTDLVAANDEPGKPWKTTLTATIANNGSVTAENVVVHLFDEGELVANDLVIASLEPGESAEVSYLFRSYEYKDSERTFSAVVDPDNAIPESDETNNEAQRLIIFEGSEIYNGSFEQSSNGQSPDGWSGSQGTGYDAGGSHSSHGNAAVSITGTGLPAGVLNPTWTSAPIDVAPGQLYNLAMQISTAGLSSAPRLQVVYLNAMGNVIGQVTGIVTNITGTSAVQEVAGQITIPPGVSQVKVVLVGFSPTDLKTQGTVWFDEIWLWTE
jgi:hypothetical protein